MHKTLTPAPKNVFWTSEAKMAYVLLTPALIVLLAFMLYPIIYVFLMAFSKTTKLGKIMGFTGFDNFRLLLRNKAFWEVTTRSFVWTAISVTSKTIVGLVIALLLNVKFAGRKIYRTLVILPWATSVPISVLLWQWIYQSEFGLLNHTLKLIGIKNPPMWLAYPKSAFFANIYVDIWIGIPFMALVFLAGLQAIPRDIYESADVDGASILKKFWHITLPMLKRVLLIATLLSALWTFNSFPVIYILTKGGPMNSTDILITFIYKYSFQFLKFGPAAAMAVITFGILVLVSVIYAYYYFKSEEL